MKRLIKFYNPYESDGVKFNISTRYEILPELVEDNAGSKELRELAKKYKAKIVGNTKTVETTRDLSITHAIKTSETIENKWKKGEKFNWYFGFINLPNVPTLPPKVSLLNKMTADQAFDLINLQECGIDDVGKNIDGNMVLVQSSHDYDHVMNLLGYDRTQFEKINKITDFGFYDDTYRCSCCGVYDSRDNGYTYNHRELNGELLGLNCGCFADACEDRVEDFANESDQCIELEVAERLVEKKKLKFIERFVGGMTDANRSHSYAGKTVRIGNPKEILEDLLEKKPNGNFVFCHDESGQFQTYFSVYELKKGKTK